MVFLPDEKKSHCVLSSTYSKIKMTPRGLARLRPKDDTRIHEVFHTLCSPWRRFDPLLVNIQEIIRVRETCGIQYWNYGLHHWKRKFIPNFSQCMLGPTWSGPSCVSLTLISYDSLWDSVFHCRHIGGLLSPNTPCVPALCVAGSCPLLRSLLKWH